MGPRLDDELLNALVGAVGSAAARTAVATIAWILPVELEVSRVGLCWYEPDADLAIVTAVWSKHPTSATVGVSHPAHGAMFESFGAVLHGKTAGIRLFGDHEGVPHVLEDLLIEEGNASAVQIPLMEEDRVLAVLTIFSASRDAFLRTDLAFFDRVGEALSATLIPLAHTAADAIRSAQAP